MAHFAEIDENNNVIRVIVIDNIKLYKDGIEDEATGVAYCQSLFGGNWVQTSYNGSFRKQFCGKGYSYDKDKDIFISPQPFPSWSLDENNNWQPPITMPVDGLCWWDEEALKWVTN